MGHIFLGARFGKHDSGDANLRTNGSRCREGSDLLDPSLDFALVGLSDLLMSDIRKGKKHTGGPRPRVCEAASARYQGGPASLPGENCEHFPSEEGSGLYGEVRGRFMQREGIYPFLKFWGMEEIECHRSMSSVKKCL